MNSAWRFSLQLLGSAAIIEENGAAVGGRAAQRHRIALLALLSLAPGRRLSRDKLIALLWPETSTERGRSLLNASVYALRTALGDDALQSMGDDLCLNSEAVGSDVTEFESALERGDHEQAVMLYTGPFLDGFFLSGAPEFERWVEGQRERLGRARAKAVEELGEGAVARGDHARAAEWWRLLASDDPYNSRVALRLMTALAASGDPAGAIRHARVHTTLLKEDVGVEPDPDLMAFVARLKAGSVADSEDPALNAVTLESVPDEQPRGTPAQQRALQPPSASTPTTSASMPVRRRRSLRMPAALVLGVIVLALAVQQRWFAEPAPSVASVAVLPFVNMGGDPNDDYFSDGMTEELIHALTGVDGLRVTARTSAFQFKGQNIDVREIGRRLGVAALVEGSVRRSGDRLKVTAQLVSSEDGTHLWSDVYERELKDALALQEEIARSIAGAFRQRLTGKVPLVASHSEDLESYHLYLKARYAASRRTPALLELAIDYFNQAIARDSNYALAWSGLANAESRLYDIAGYDPGELVPRIRDAALRALELDSTLAEPYAMLGWIHTHAWEWPEAEAAFKRAIALEPNNPDTYQDYSMYLDNRGRFEEALEVCLLAKDLDPLSPRVGYNVAGSYLHLARFEPAIAEARAMIALNPNLPLGYDALGWALVDSGKPLEAIEPLERAVTLGGGRWLALANLGRAYALTGRETDARAVLARLKRDWGHTGFGHFAMAAVHLALGERKLALQSLEQVYKLRFAKVPHQRQWSAFEPLYNDPEFLRIVREAGFTF
jgi:serine/threonine-protein kinase